MAPVIHERFRAARVRSVALFALVAAFVTGCGPFGYLTKVARDATRAVADAEAAGAEEFAPYEYWGAVAYLEQAKVLMAYSEYERSFDYGTRAKQLAEEAKKKADRREAGKDRETLEDDAPKAESSGAKGEAGVSVQVGGEK
jgi:hypothetical protein